MKKLASILRCILLTLAMVSGLLICIFHVDVETDAGSILVCLLCGAGALYLFVSIISVVVRRISRIHLSEMDKVRESFTGTINYIRNMSMLHYFRRLSFWGTMMLVVNIIEFGLNSNMMIGGPYSADVFLAGYHGFLLWALLAFIVSFVLSVLFWVVYMPHYGQGAYSIFQYMGKILVSDVTAPFRIVKSFFDRKNKDMIGLITMLMFVGVNLVAVLKSR